MIDIQDTMTQDVLPNDWVARDAMIKVIGVGGAGCNAVTYMNDKGVKGCDFIICNTDSQALLKSSVETRIQLGKSLLGAGTDPKKGRDAALESQDAIKKLLFGEEEGDNGTKMVFITAGMGGGTGTGASPVIAKIAKDRKVLTVAVVTLPFEHEGPEALAKAKEGINELEKNVDSLIMINNQKLYKYFGNLLIQDAFPKADEVLSTAVSSIIDIIKHPGYINVDFEDVKTMMRNSGRAVMGCGSGKGKHRLEEAVKGALESPLLNDFDLKTAKNVLINITTGKNKDGVTMQELSSINEMINQYTGGARKFKSGIVWDDDPNFGDEVRITAIATGFKSGIGGGANENANIIMIDRGFTYENFVHQSQKGEIDLPDTEISTIGYSTVRNKRTFKFQKDRKPALIVREGMNIGELEGTAAIRRKTAMTCPNTDK